MNRFVLTTCIGSFFLQLAIVNAQSHRIFLQKAGESPIGVPPEGITIELVDGNATIVLDAYVEQAPPGERVNGVLIAMPCQADDGTQGTVTFASPVTQDIERVDKCFHGRYCTGGPNIGLPCTAATALSACGAIGLCGAQSLFDLTDDGNCAGGPPPFPRAAFVHGTTQPAIVLVDACYLGTFTYEVSSDALGTFEIAVINAPHSVSHNQNDNDIPFVTSGATINVPAGRCCNGTACLGEMNSIACANLGGVFSVGQTCADLCCSSYSDCDDDNPCVFETCQSLTCSSHPVRFGDTNGSGGLVDIDDILCINNGFANIANCPNADIIPNCTGNDIIDLDDILGVIVAFGGADPCGCN